MVKCKYCGRNFVDVNALAKHYYEAHRLRNPYAHALAAFVKRLGGAIHYTNEMKEFDRFVNEELSKSKEGERKGGVDSGEV